MKGRDWLRRMGVATVHYGGVGEWWTRGAQWQVTEVGC